MKKIIFVAILILAMQILASCQWRSNIQKSSNNLSNNQISDNHSKKEGGDYLPKSYTSEDKFLTWLESQRNFDEKYRRLFAIDKVRFKLKTIPEGYNLNSISVQMNLVTYSYKMGNAEVYLKFQYDTIHYYDIDKGSISKTFEQTMHNFDKIVQKDNRTYYVGYPKTLHDEVFRGSVVWNIDNYRCAVYTVGIGSFDDSIIEYCDYEKVPLNMRSGT